MDLSRRHLIRSAANLAIAAPALRLLGACGNGSDPAPSPTRPAVAKRVSNLALVPDPQRLLDLAPGLSYATLSRAGEEMSDGLLVPGLHDGMAAFPVAGDPARCRLVRNHEQGAGAALSPFGSNNTRVALIDPARLYDPGASGPPFAGGTTTLLVNVATRVVERSHLSLAGTAINCSGGPTPWGSWLSCEETEMTSGNGAAKSHGFVFEVPSAAPGPADPVPLAALGRFRHEAAAVDPSTGIVYLTEDQGDGLIYRFLPDTRGELVRGGRLQALALVQQSGADTRNWPASIGGDPSQRMIQNTLYPVRWVDLAGIDSPGGDLRLRGRAAGAAIFARGEGMAFALEPAGAAIYFSTTSGGAAGLGQVWRYLPSPYEGTSNEAAARPQLELFVESAGATEFDNADNIVASPAGELIVCEDGAGDQFVRAITPDGLIYSIARCADPSQSEFCGACFSPDGSTMFVNIQRVGVTCAIYGDWAAVRTAARLAS